ncbi:MAG: inositol monophosphatase [Sutterella parvirubra]|nr:inositol monophosphatase [Sutterella parvirubra]MDR3769880.1 inositol monophosphatase family protein [Sutterella sp.]MDY5202032.1 inositol monophosphatase family protein [Sutterella parvirubra]
MSSQLHLTAYIATAVKAARRAAKEITRAAADRDRLEVEHKAINDFVTSADRAAEAAILDELRYAYPKHAFLSEEAGRTGDEDSDFLWIIDPIDGTTNFMHGLPHYAVSIALLHRGDVIVGVVYDVAKNELFTAAKGQGAYLDNRRIRVSETKDLRRALIGTGFPFRRTDDFEGYMHGFQRVAEHTAGIRRPGSAALDLAWVACGRYDGYWEQGLSSWDIAAGVLLVLEAGGLITDLKGGEGMLDNGSVCAGTPRIFAKLLPLVGKLPAPKPVKSAK